MIMVQRCIPSIQMSLCSVAGEPSLLADDGIQSPVVADMLVYYCGTLENKCNVCGNSSSGFYFQFFLQKQISVNNMGSVYFEWYSKV